MLYCAKQQKNELKYATSYTEFAGDFYLHLEFTEPDSEMRREIKFTFDRENSYLEKALKELGLI